MDARQNPVRAWPHSAWRLTDPKEPMEKPDPYAEWVLFARNQDPSRPPLPVDEELLAAARKAWPHVVAHARRRLLGKELGRERAALAAEIWDRVLLSVAKTRQRNKGLRSPITDLESYLIGVFLHRFSRELKKERKRVETIEAFSSVLDLEQFEAATDAEWVEQLDRANCSKSRTEENAFEAATDAEWVEQLDRAIAARQIFERMSPWMKKVWQRRQCNYSWKRIASWLGITERQAKMKFHYGLQKIRQRMVRSLEEGKSEKTN